MSTQEMESFFGTIFSPEGESSPSIPNNSGQDTSLSVSRSEDPSLFTTLFKWLQKKGLYVVGAIMVLMLIVWLYRSYRSRMVPEHFELEEPFDDHEVLTEDMIIDAERSAPVGSIANPLPSFPEPVHQPPPLISDNPLIQLEQQLTRLYSEFETFAKNSSPDLRSLHTRISGMASVLAKMKEHILPVLQSDQAPSELKQQLQKGLQDAELILTMAQNKIEEIKRIHTVTENDQETKSVVKNMHYLGLGNKIKRAKGQLPSV